MESTFVLNGCRLIGIVEGFRSHLCLTDVIEDLPRKRDACTTEGARKEEGLENLEVPPEQGLFSTPEGSGVLTFWTMHVPGDVSSSAYRIPRAVSRFPFVCKPIGIPLI